MDIQHTVGCLEREKLALAAREEYTGKWPNFCKKCRGWGGFASTYDPSPAGVSLSPGFMYDFDVCPACVEEGICPRCGEQSLDEEGNVCSSCGWTSDDEGLPPMHECFCWEAEW